VKFDFCGNRILGLLFIDSFSSSSIWWHQLIIIVPRIIRRNTDVFLYTDGGSNDDPYDYLMRKKYFF
jgi:hypothetical protein